MMNIVSLDGDTILRLAERLTAADMQGRSVRIMTGSDNIGTYIKWAIGGDCWTPAYYDVDGM